MTMKKVTIFTMTWLNKFFSVETYDSRSHASSSPPHSRSVCRPQQSPPGGHRKSGDHLSSCTYPPHNSYRRTTCRDQNRRRKDHRGPAGRRRTSRRRISAVPFQSTYQIRWGPHNKIYRCSSSGRSSPERCLTNGFYVPSWSCHTCHTVCWRTAAGRLHEGHRIGHIGREDQN